MAIRNRFDLLSTTEKERELSVKFMIKFAEYMSKLSQNNFSLFEFSFYTSHTMENEIRKYSLNDIKYVGISFFLFWIVYTFLSIFDFKFISNIIKKYIFKKLTTNKFTYVPNNQCSTNFDNWCIRKNIILPLMSFVQFIFTIIASLGLISLLGIEANELLFSSIFVLMSTVFFNICFILIVIRVNSFSIYLVNSCHQSLLIHKNIKKLIANFQDNLNKEINENLESELKYNLADIVHLNVVPNSFSLLTVILAYSVISITSSFDSIRIYSLFLGNIFRFFCSF
jgi:hypothetical protein